MWLGRTASVTSKKVDFPSTSPHIYNRHHTLPHNRSRRDILDSFSSFPIWMVTSVITKRVTYSSPAWCRTQYASDAYRLCDIDHIDLIRSAYTMGTHLKILCVRPKNHTCVRISYTTHTFIASGALRPSLSRISLYFLAKTRLNLMQLAHSVAYRHAMGASGGICHNTHVQARGVNVMWRHFHIVTYRTT